jgi:asparagine synthase (glutamine-hydrolysing)
VSGIAAVLRTDPAAPPELGLLERLVSAMAFRGPDRAETRAEAGFCAGIAGMAGDQGTQLAAQGQILLACVARIDGRGELLKTLRRHGRLLRDDVSDAQLLLDAYLVWDSAFAEHVIGDFAVVIWDGQLRRLCAAVDRFAVRPLFYCVLGDRLILSNTPKGILDSGAVSDAIDETALGDFLTFGYSSDAHATIHRAIRSVPAAHRLIATQDGLTVEPYWQVPRACDYLLHRSRADYVAHFRQVFFRAVADRLPSSGPVHVMMSGGMDSTSVAAAACAILGREAAAQRLVAHTVVHRDLENEGEGRFAELVAQRLGIPLRKIVAEDFRIWVLEQDEEQWLPPRPAYPRGLTFESALARNVVAAGGVIMGGLGGDPLFASRGATLWSLVQARRSRAIADVVRYARVFGSLPPLGIRGRIAPLLGTPPPAVPVWINRAFARRTGLDERAMRHRLQILRAKPQQLLTNASWSQVLSLGDPGQSGFPIDARHPFMDVRLLEHVLRLPPPMLLRKSVLREAMSDLLPEAVLGRPKTILGNAPAVAERQHAAILPTYEGLLAAVPHIAEYVDLRILRRCLVEPNERTVFGLMRFEMVALWLAGRKRHRSG